MDGDNKVTISELILQSQRGEVVNLGRGERLIYKYTLVLVHIYICIFVHKCTP